MEKYLNKLRAIDTEHAHQKTIDVIRDTTNYLSDAAHVKEDDLYAINQGIDILLDVFNPDFTHDIELICQMDNVITEWRDSLD